MLTAQNIIDFHHLTPIPDEGGLYVQTYISEDRIPKDSLPVRYRGSKQINSAILFFLDDTPDCFSAIHRLPTDEIYHFYLGDPVELLMLFPDGSSKTVTLGRDILNGQSVQFVVPRGIWQGSHLLSGGKFALMGASMAPGFDPTDFTPGKRKELIHLCPQQSELIRKLTCQ